MILKINGELKPYYAQTLCMLFFPGAKFPENEQRTPDVPEAYFSVFSNAERASADVTVRWRGREETRTSVCTTEFGVDENKARQLAAGAAFYKAASALTGICPPWGILTGVRPAKIASELLRCGKSVPQTAEWISDHYMTSPQKARLAAAVADAERRLIRTELVKACSVYIGIPFCPSRCSYCSFVSYTSPKLLSLIPEYLTALKANIHTVFETIRFLHLPVSTVYIGGGTPTVLDAEQLRFLLDTISSETDVSSLEEFTLEAGRPDTITEDKLSVARASGVTRISVNAQTLNDEILASIGRRHTSVQFMRAYEMARASGIRHINVDLIAGLTGESAESFSRSLDRIISLSPDDITVHAFSVKKAAEIRQTNETVYDGIGSAASESVDYAQYALSSAGYIPYYMYRQKNTVGNLENVGYSKPGAEGLYNIYMMEEVHSIFAAGASAVTKLVSPTLPDGRNCIDRIFEAKYPYEYLKAFEGISREEKENAYFSAVRAFYEKYF